MTRMKKQDPGEGTSLVLLEHKLLRGNPLKVRKCYKSTSWDIHEEVLRKFLLKLCAEGIF